MRSHAVGAVTAVPAAAVAVTAAEVAVPATAVVVPTATVSRVVACREREHAQSLQDVMTARGYHFSPITYGYHHTRQSSSAAATTTSDDASDARAVTNT